MTLSTGDVINARYRIVALLGQGGFGAVYKAWDLNLKIPCALKENFETDPASVRQFEREASLLAVLRHPGLPRVTDHFIVPERGQYLVMDFIEGRDLQSILDATQAPLAEPQVLGWMSEILDALEYLHTQEIAIIHRDIKPANIKITPAGRAVLVDFGIAKAYNPGLRTTQGARAVTPGYSPFEQYGQAPTDARTDLYALGATAYALLTGKPPAESIARMAGMPLEPPRALNPAISPHVEQAILTALELMPANRFPSAAAFKKALVENPIAGNFQSTMAVQPAGSLRAQTLAAPATPPAAHPEERTPQGRSRSWIWIGGLAFLAVAIFAIWQLLPAVSPPADEPQAELPLVSTEIEAAPPTEPPPPTATKVSAPAVLPPVDTQSVPSADFSACQVTDAGGIDDRSFNATAWKGVQDAVAELGIEGKYLESQQQTDYEKNVNAFVEEGCDIIITVGFLLGDATQAAAEANPDQKFSIVDFAYDPAIPNVLGQVFATDQAGFLAGYAAAGVTKTGAVGTFGGIQIPTVTVFMDGFALGVQHYNEVHGTDVRVLGWDPEAQTGLFTGNFESTDDGRTMGETLMDEGADIIMPVAGPVGLGTAAAAKERGNVYIIGVDSDWYETAPDYKDITLTSVMKFMDVTTFNAIQSAKDGTFEGGVTVGTLENGGVGLAPFHDLDSMVASELKTELDQVKADIIGGTLATTP